MINFCANFAEICIGNYFCAKCCKDVTIQYFLENIGTKTIDILGVPIFHCIIIINMKDE